MRIKLLLILLISGLLFTSCCGCRKATSKFGYTLTSGEWKLIEMNDVSLSGDYDEDSFTITFDSKENKFYGKAECNRYFGGYSEQDVRQITFSQIGSTMMACRDGNLEREFLKLLEGIDSYTVDQDMLMLQKDKGVVLIFKMNKPGEAKSE